jgi:hypothetical protein
MTEESKTTTNNTRPTLVQMTNSPTGTGSTSTRTISTNASTRSMLSTSSQSVHQQYNKFYIQANTTLTLTKEQLAKNVNAEELTKIHQKIMITLDTITKLIFGLSANRKAQVVVHGGGAIELIVGLVRASKVLELDNDEMYVTALSKPIILSSLKAIKTCVLRNPAGRCRCRSANVFEFLKDILNAIVKDFSGNKEQDNDDDDNKLLVEQVFTTLAAICLGDDLNALQVRDRLLFFFMIMNILAPNNKIIIDLYRF